MLGIAFVLRTFGRVVRRLAKDPESRGLATLAALLIGGGTLFYRSVEDLSWLDSIYFTVVTLTTVGYGDIHPTTGAGKVFTIFYLIIGVGVLVSFVAVTARILVETRQESTTERRQKRQRRKAR